MFWTAPAFPLLQSEDTTPSAYVFKSQVPSYRLPDMRWLLVLGIFLSLALAGPCGGRPYTLETEEGLLGGQEMSYDGEVLVFEGQACLEREGLYLEASTIRYLEAEGTFQGEELQGEIEGWRLTLSPQKGPPLGKHSLGEAGEGLVVAAKALGRGQALLLGFP